MRICSFLPSATEIVYALGLGDSLFGITYECDFPAEAQRKPVIVKSRFNSEELQSHDIDLAIRTNYGSGQSTYVIDQELLLRADPDLILTQELCDVCAASPNEVEKAIQSLKRRPRIVSLTPKTLTGIFETILQVGEATDRTSAAERLVGHLRERVQHVKLLSERISTRPRVVCLEWLDPLFCGGHWIPEMVHLAGGFDGLGKPGSKSFRISWEQIVDYAPEIAVLMPCGFHIDRTLREIGLLTHQEGWDRLPAVISGNIFLVDASSYFSRPGPRIVTGLEILAKIINPELSISIPQGALQRLQPVKVQTKWGV